jgi:hypothetical protein
MMIAMVSGPRTPRVDSMGASSDGRYDAHREPSVPHSRTLSGQRGKIAEGCHMAVIRSPTWVGPML